MHPKFICVNSPLVKFGIALQNHLPIATTFSSFPSYIFRFQGILNGHLALVRVLLSFIAIHIFCRKSDLSVLKPRYEGMVERSIARGKLERNEDFFASKSLALILKRSVTMTIHSHCLPTAYGVCHSVHRGQGCIWDAPPPSDSRPLDAPRPAWMHPLKWMNSPSPSPVDANAPSRQTDLDSRNAFLFYSL